MDELSLHVELALSVLVVGFTGWVLVLQPLGLLRSMPKRQFIGLQMRLVRHWIRLLVPMTTILVLLAALRLRWAAWPAAIAFAATLIAALWAIPRALRAGGRTMASEGGARDHTLEAGDFLADGGGAGTRVWHRVVLLCVLGLVGGALANAHGILHTGRDDHHAAMTATHSAPAGAETATAVVRRRYVADGVTASTVQSLETEVARLLAARGNAPTDAIVTAWGAIFAGCTMVGEAHDALHSYLMPMAPIIDRLASSTAEDRVIATRDLLRRLSQWDDWFTQGG